MVRRLVRALASLFGLAVIAAVPWMLWAVIRGPLTDRSVEELRSALGRGELPPEVVVAVLVVVAALAWFQVVVAVVVEVAARVRRRPVPTVRGLGSGQRLAALLVGGLTVIATLAPRTPGGEPRRAHAYALAQPVGAELGRSLASAAVASPSIVVQQGDTLSGIAAAHLGSETAWPEIWERNQGREFGGRRFDNPHLILPGWELYLPAVEVPGQLDAPVQPAPEMVRSDPLLPVTPTVATTATTSAPAEVTPPRPSGQPCDPATEEAVEAAATPPADPEIPPDLPVGRDFPVPAGAAVLLAAGVVGLADALRRRQLRRAAVGARFAEPSAAVQATDRALREVGRAERVARLDVALRAAAATLSAGSEPGPCPRVLAVLAPADGCLELLLSDDRTAEAPFVPGAQAGRWMLPADVELADLAQLARAAAMPCPTLVQIGTSRGAGLFVDVEAWGTLGIEAPPERAAIVLQALVTELALSPFAHAVEIGVVDLPEVVDLPRITSHPDSETALEAAVSATTAVRAAAQQHGSTFGLRARADAESWEPTVLAVLQGGVGDVPAGQGLAVLQRGRPATGCWLTERDGGWWFEPLGLPLVPTGAALDEIAAIRALLDHAGEAPVEPVITGSGVQRELKEFAERPWQLLVRLLGPPDVVAADGNPAEFERSKALELVVWLSQHRQRATRTGARTALWDVDVQSATFANVVSDARRGMARCVTPPEGEEWIGRTLTEDLPLHEQVATDVELVSARLRHSSLQDDHAAIDTLRPAVAMVRGMPLEGTMYTWADAEGLSSNLVMLAVSVTGELARRHLAVGDVAGVLEATARGLRVLPGHEELLALRMRAHARAGDLQGLRAEWTAYERALAADPWADDPSERLIALRQELLATLTPVPSV
jgi:hypothetical protein